jgi:hypothetical protein
MSQSYRYSVTLEDFDPDRKGELKEYLKTLHPKVGTVVLKGYLRAALAGEHPLIYESNSKIDAWRIANMIATKGGGADIVGMDDEEDDDL